MSKHHSSPTAIVPQSAAEALVVQHALAFYRDMKQHAQNAPFGEFLNYAEAVAINKGRELVKTSLQTLVQEEVNEVEKKRNETLQEMSKAKKESGRSNKRNRNRHRNDRS